MNPITANQIAKKIKRSRPSVVEQIEKLSIEPMMTSSGMKFYHPDVAVQIDAAMRKPNKKTQSL